MAGLSIKGVESDHHVTGAFERSRRHPLIHAIAVHDHVGLELLFEACKSHVLVCTGENKTKSTHEALVANSRGTSRAEGRPEPNLSSLLTFNINLHNITFSLSVRGSG